MKTLILLLLFVSMLAATVSAEELTKEEIAYELDIKSIYDPIQKKNVLIERMTREQFISYLNNAVTQKITFGGNADWARKKLAEMDLVVEGYRYENKPDYFYDAPQEQMGGDGPTGDTSGLKTRSQAIREEGFLQGEDPTRVYRTPYEDQLPTGYSYFGGPATGGIPFWIIGIALFFIGLGAGMLIKKKK